MFTVLLYFLGSSVLEMRSNLATLLSGLDIGILRLVGTSPTFRLADDMDIDIECMT